MTTTAIIPATLADAANLTKSGQFAYLKRHESKDGTVSNRLIQTQCSYTNLLFNAIVGAGSMTTGDIAKIAADLTAKHEGKVFDVATMNKAWEGQIASWQKSLDGLSDRVTGYDYHAPGVATCDAHPGIIYLQGLQVAVTVHVHGIRKPVNSRALTLAKAAIRRTQRVSDYRMFRLSGAFESLSMSGRTLTHEDLMAKAVSSE